MNIPFLNMEKEAEFLVKNGLMKDLESVLLILASSSSDIYLAQNQKNLRLKCLNYLTPKLY